MARGRAEYGHGCGEPLQPWGGADSCDGEGERGVPSVLFRNEDAKALDHWT